MKCIKSGDLKNQLVLLAPESLYDDEGGWHGVWHPQKTLWGYVHPIIGRDGFHRDDLGGGMAANQGYVRSLPPARYYVVVRAEEKIPLQCEFLWRRGMFENRLALSCAPYLIQDHSFWCMKTTAKIAEES